MDYLVNEVLNRFQYYGINYHINTKSTKTKLRKIKIYIAKNKTPLNLRYTYKSIKFGKMTVDLVLFLVRILDSQRL